MRVRETRTRGKFRVLFEELQKYGYFQASNRENRSRIFGIEIFAIKVFHDEVREFLAVQDTWSMRVYMWKVLLKDTVLRQSFDQILTPLHPRIFRIPAFSNLRE